MGTRFITLTDMALYGACPYKYHLHSMQKIPIPPSPLALQGLLAQAFGAIQELAPGFVTPARDKGCPAAARDLLDTAIARSISSHAQGIMGIDYAFILETAYALLTNEAERRICEHMQGRESALLITKGAYVCDFAHRLKGTIPGIVRADGRMSPVVIPTGTSGTSAQVGETWCAMGMGLLCRYAFKDEVRDAIRYDPQTGESYAMAMGDDNKEKTKELLAITRATTVFLAHEAACGSCEYRPICDHNTHRK